MGVVGAAIKGFGKALKTAKRNKASKQVFKIIQGKGTKAFGKGALIGGAVASGIEYKRRKDRGDYKK